MMPKGRLVETSEIVFVKKEQTSVSCSPVDEANGMVFKTSSGQCFLVWNISLRGEFGTSAGALWNTLLKEGYADLFSLTNAKAKAINHELYAELLFKDNGIG